MRIDVFQKNNAKNAHHGCKDVIKGKVVCRLGVCKAQDCFEVGYKKSAGTGFSSHVEKHREHSEKEVPM